MPPPGRMTNTAPGVPATEGGAVTVIVWVKVVVTGAGMTPAVGEGCNVVANTVVKVCTRIPGWSVIVMMTEMRIGCDWKTIVTTELTEVTRGCKVCVTVTTVGTTVVTVTGTPLTVCTTVVWTVVVTVVTTPMGVFGRGEMPPLTVLVAGELETAVMVDKAEVVIDAEPCEVALVATPETPTEPETKAEGMEADPETRGMVTEAETIGIEAEIESVAALEAEKPVVGTTAAALAEIRTVVKPEPTASWFWPLTPSGAGVF